jgi:sulfur-carrier protein
MSVSVLIPTVLRKYTSGKDEVSLSGATVREVIQNLGTQFQSLATAIHQDNGELKPFINIYVNEEDIRFLNSLDTAVQPNDTITILPAIAGG